MEVTDKEIEDFLDHYLEHHGVKGMKWGVRRSQNRSLNKASRAKDRKQSDKDIDKARSRTKGTSRAARLGFGDKGSKSHTEFKRARTQYKADRAVMGSREARKILNKAREKRIDEIATSRQAKSGRETTFAILGAVGAALLTPAGRY